jgi:hypothetical protein
MSAVSTQLLPSIMRTERRFMVLAPVSCQRLEQDSLPRE